MKFCCIDLLIFREVETKGEIIPFAVLSYQTGKIIFTVKKCFPSIFW